MCWPFAVPFISLVLINSFYGAELHEEGRRVRESQERICEEGLEGADVVLLLSFMLLLGIVVRYPLRRIPVLYPVLLLVFGLILGLMQIQLTRPGRGHGIDSEDHDRWEKFATGIDIWQRIEPDLLMLAFLSALIFSSAFSLNLHITKRSIVQVLILAGPGVVIETILTALFVKYVFPYDWCWPKVLLFGAMLSTTDPAVVIARLKKVGASEQLGTLIEGESLFTVATAFVFYSLFRDMIPATEGCLIDKDNCLYNGASFCEAGRFVVLGCTHYRSLGESVGFFFQLMFGGLAIGILFGLAATLWIRYTYMTVVIEMSVTLVLAYLTFAMAEEVAEVSGVLAVMAFGLFMGSSAKDRISSSVHEPFHVFWEMLHYLADTLIFVYTGLKLAVEFFETENEEGKWIHAREWSYAALLYLALQFIRFIMIFSLLPVLRKMGSGMTWRDALVPTWGGIRGAVGLTAALTVTVDVDHIPASFRSYTIFYSVFVVIATLLINDTTMPYLLKLLGMTKSSPEKLEFLCHLVLEIEEHGRKRAMEIEDDILGDADQQELAKLTELDIDRIIPNNDETRKVMAGVNEASAMALEASLARLNHSQVPEETEAEMTEISKTQSDNTDQIQPRRTRLSRAFNQHFHLVNFYRKEHPLLAETTKQDLLIQDVRKRLLRGVKTVYAERLEKGDICATVMLDLIKSTDEAIDHLESGINDWEYIKDLAKPPQWLVELQQFKNKFGQGPVGNLFDKSISKFLFKSLRTVVLLLRTFIETHHDAEHTLHEYIKTAVNEDRLQENQSQIEMLEEAVDKVIQESKSASAEAHGRLRDYRNSYPEVLRAIKTHLSADQVLLEKQKFIKGIKRAGLIENEEAEFVSCILDAKLKQLHYLCLHLHMPSQRDLLHSQALFLALEKTILDSQVFHVATSKTLKEHDIVYLMGDIPQNVMIITQGLVKIIAGNSEEESLVDGFGTVIGVAEVMLNQPMMTTVVSEMTGEGFMIERDQFLNLVENYKSIRQVAWKLTGLMLTWIKPWGDFIGCSFQQISNSFYNSDLLEFEPQTEFRLASTAYLIVGRVQETGLDQFMTNVIEAPAPLGLGPGVYYSFEEVRILLMLKDMTIQTPSIQVGQELRRRMLAMSSTSLDCMSNRLPRTNSDLHNHEASTSALIEIPGDHSTLIDIPEDASLLGHSESEVMRSRRRLSLVLQRRTYDNADSTMRATLEMIRSLTKEAMREREKLNYTL